MSSPFFCQLLLKSLFAKYSFKYVSTLFLIIPFFAIPIPMFFLFLHLKIFGTFIDTLKQSLINLIAEL